MNTNYKLFFLILFINLSCFGQQITSIRVECKLITNQGVEFIGEVKDKSNEDIYMMSNWSNQSVLYFNSQEYSLSNINFNVSTNSFDSKIDRIKLFSYNNSTIDSVKINNHLFKKVEDIFYQVLFEQGNNLFLKKFDIKINKGAINRLDLSEGKSFSTLIYIYLIKFDNVFEKVDLNKKSILGLLKNEKDQDKLIEFVKQQNLSYKNEVDVVKMFEYILKI